MFLTKINKTYKTYFFIFIIIIVLLYNSYKNSFQREGYSGGAKDINIKFEALENKYEKLKIVIAMLQTEIKLIKNTIDSKLK